MNHFQFFDLPVSFYLDEKDLKKRFLVNCRKYHPDFYTMESEEKQAEVLELSTQNNNAFRILSDFDKRMAYMLQIKGVLGEEGKNDIPQTFLMDVMEIQESIMGLEFGYEEKAFETAKKQVAQLEKKLNYSIEPILQSYDDKTSDTGELIAVKEYYLKKKYLLRIKENLNRFAPASPKGAIL